MTQEKMSPLRARMIPPRACKHALPGSGTHAYPRDGGDIAEGAYTCAQGFHNFSGALAGYGDAKRSSCLSTSYGGHQGHAADI